MIKYFTIEDLLKHYLQKKFHILYGILEKITPIPNDDKYIRIDIIKFKKSGSVSIPGKINLLITCIKIE